MYTMENLSKTHKDRISTWINNLPQLKGSLTNGNWIKKNHNTIYKDLTERYTNKNSLKSHLSTLAVVLKELNSLKPYKLYSDISTAIQKQVSNKAKEQVMDDKRKANFVCFDDIVKRRDELRDRFRADKTDNKTNLLYVLLSLYTYQAPLRQDWKDVIITKKKPPVKTQQNYLWNNKILFLNHDKVVKNAYGRAQIEISKELQDVITESLEAFPRKYVLSLINDGNKPLGKQNFERLLGEIFAPKKLSVDLLRSSYITDKYDNKAFSLKDKEELAKLMRHSASTANENYNKIDVDCVKNPPPVTPMEPPPTPIEPPQPRKYFNLKEYMKKYREEHKEKLKEQRMAYYTAHKDQILRNKILWNLNKARNTKEPSAESMAKYDIRYDEELKKWV